MVSDFKFSKWKRDSQWKGFRIVKSIYEIARKITILRYVKKQIFDFTWKKNSF